MLSIIVFTYFQWNKKLIIAESVPQYVFTCVSVCVCRDRIITKLFV